MAIAKLGQRIPLALKFAKMLEELIIKDCDAAFHIPIHASTSAETGIPPLSGY